MDREVMQIARFKSAHTAKHGINPSRATLLRMFLVAVGCVGTLIFGFLMDASLAPIRSASGLRSDNGFITFTDGLIIPGFILSLGLVVYGVYELYKIYRQLNDPKNYRNRSRRTSS